MVNHIWSLLCRRSTIDSETNNLSIYDVFEQLTIDLKIKTGNADKVTKINVPIEYEVVSLWSKSEDKVYSGEAKVEIIDPTGETGKVFEEPIEMPQTMKRLRTRLRISGFVAEKSGIYNFQVSYRVKGEDKYKKVADIPLEIIIKKEIVSELPNTNPSQASIKN